MTAIPPPDLLQRKKDAVGVKKEGRDVTRETSPLSPTRRNADNVMVKQEFKPSGEKKPGSGSGGGQENVVDLRTP